MTEPVRGGVIIAVPDRLASPSAPRPRAAAKLYASPGEPPELGVSRNFIFHRTSIWKPAFSFCNLTGPPQGRPTRGGEKAPASPAGLKAEQLHHGAAGGKPAPAFAGATLVPFAHPDQGDRL
jgi:hypothetical protein